MFKSVVASLFALASLVAAQAPVNDPSINSPPSVVQCQPVQISWTAAKEPVWVSIIPGGTPGAAPIKDFGQQAPGTKQLSWTCDLKAETPITFQIRDSTGAVAYSANVNVQDSSDSSCVDPNQTIPAAPTKSTPAAPGPATSAPAPAPATSAAASPTKAADVSTSRAPAAATSATPTSSSVAAANAALPGAQLGWTGLVGVLAAFIVV